MHRVTWTWARGIFGAGIVAALGIGAAQAVAAPVVTPASACHPEACLNTCSSKGFDSGYCSGGACHCIRL